jgi:hypothetical protein
MGGREYSMIRFENGIYGYRIDLAVVVYEPLTCDE